VKIERYNGPREFHAMRESGRTVDRVVVEMIEIVVPRDNAQGPRHPFHDDRSYWCEWRGQVAWLPWTDTLLCRPTPLVAIEDAERNDAVLASLYRAGPVSTEHVRLISDAIARRRGEIWQQVTRLPTEDETRKIVAFLTAPRSAS
jgi:hypothetical protein